MSSADNLSGTGDDSFNLGGGNRSHAEGLDHVNQLCGLVCENVATADDYRQLNKLLESSSIHRQQYLRFMNLHAALALRSAISRPGMLETRDTRHDGEKRRDGESSDGTVRPNDAQAIIPAPHHVRPLCENKVTVGRSELLGEVVGESEHERPRPISRDPLLANHPRRLLAASFATSTIVLAILLCALSQFDIQPYFRNRADSAAERPIATLTYLEGCVWALPNTNWRVGQTLRLGSKVELARGVVELTYAQGPSLVLEGPVVYTLEQADEGQLSLGRLTASVPPQAVGFTVNTPRMAAVDLGTEFGLNVSKTGEVELHVLKGRVRAEFLENKSVSRSVDVVVGQGVRLASASSKHEMIPADGNQFIRRAGEKWAIRAPPVPTILVPEFAPAMALIPGDMTESDPIVDGWKLATFDPSIEWLRGRTGVGYDTKTDTLKPFVNLTVERMFEKYGTVLLRIPFEVTADPATIRRLELSMRYDDGFVAYLNGRQVTAVNAPESLTFSSMATGPRTETLETTEEQFDISQYSSEIRLGTNCLAIQGLNHQLKSTDLLISPKLTAYFNSPKANGEPTLPEATRTATADSGGK